MRRYKLRMDNEYTRAKRIRKKRDFFYRRLYQIRIDYDEGCFSSSYRVCIGFFSICLLSLSRFVCCLCTPKLIGQTTHTRDRCDHHYYYHHSVTRIRRDFSFFVCLWETYCIFFRFFFASLFSFRCSSFAVCVLH